jgi:hypothetical protein
MQAWRINGTDPFKLYNALDADYRPFAGGDPVKPRDPIVYQSFILACAEAASNWEAKLHQMKQQTEERKPLPYSA